MQVYDFKSVKIEGSLFSWGNGQFGQLGLGSDASKILPTKVEEFSEEDIVQISCASGLSAALTEDGKIYTWGRSKGGNLGHGETFSSSISLPTMIESLREKKFVYICCGNYHMAAITENGELYLLNKILF